LALLDCITIASGGSIIGSPCTSPEAGSTPAPTSATPTTPITTEVPPATASVPSINGVPLEYFGSKNGQCSGGKQADFDAQAAKECFASLRGSNWIDMPCASSQSGCPDHIAACDGVSVESHGTSWNNPQDCYDGCVSCLAVLMDQGWNQA